MRVLFFTEQWINGGVASFIMSLFRNFDYSEGLYIEILVSENLTYFYDEELERLNIKKTCLIGEKHINSISCILKTSKAIRRYLESTSFDIAHFHLCNAVGIKYADIAKKRGIKTIVHSHNSNVGSFFKLKINNIAKYYYQRVPDLRFSCSEPASRLLYTNSYIKKQKIKIIKNGIDVNKFIFNQKIRERIRLSLGVKNEVLLCHIGRFIYQKNHLFLLDVLYNLLNNSIDKKCYKLLLIGEGQMEDEIKEKAKKIGVIDHMIWLKNIHNVWDYLSASDLFILPSLFEGLPLVGVEAQANGLPCVFSKTISPEIGILESTVFLDLKSSELWKEIISNIPLSALNREKGATLVKQSGFDCNLVAEYIQNKYNMLVNNNSTDMDCREF